MLHNKPTINAVKILHLQRIFIQIFKIPATSPPNYIFNKNKPTNHKPALSFD